MVQLIVTSSVAPDSIPGPLFLKIYYLAGFSPILFSRTGVLSSNSFFSATLL